MLVVTSRRHLDLLEDQLARKDLRIQELERQVDELRREGGRIAPPPGVAEPAPRELPAAIEDLITGLEDAESRREWRAEAWRRLDAREPAETVAATLFR